MDQSMLAGKTLSVAQAKPQKDAASVLGSKTAVWEQEEWIKKHEVGDEEREEVERERREEAERGMDPMKALEGLDIAGPKPAAV